MQFATIWDEKEMNFLGSATSLWLGAVLAAEAKSLPTPLARALIATAALFGACGVWWPTHLTHGQQLSGLITLGGALLALLISGLALAVARLASRRTLPGLGAASLAMLAATYGHGVVASPGLLKLLPPDLPLGAEIVVMALVLALAATQMTCNAPVLQRNIRAGGALVAGAVLTLGSMASASGTSVLQSWPLWFATTALLGMVAVCSVLLMALKHGASRESEPQVHPARSAEQIDSLTKLPTRVYFESQLAAAAARCDAADTRVALLFIDLDGFKPVNDTFGHNIGDRVLAQVGERLRSMSRTVDIMARVGGDEFLLLVTGASSQDMVAQVAKRLIDGISRPYSVDEREIAISCSVGIVFYPDGGSHTKLIARADAAMYAAKQSGGSSYCFYSPTMDSDAEEKFELLRDLRQAISRSELELFFQPKIDAKSGKVTAAEALLRWQHPTRGLIMPTIFIPVAERFGLINALGSWVIEDACRQARVWRDNGLRMRVAINLSAHQMRQDDIADRVAEALERHRIHPSLLTCEITETAAMEDTKAIQETFRRFGEQGIHLSIDDFGTGYSSLSYLRRLPAAELKIDRSFVMDLESSSDARAVVDAVVRLAHALGLKVVAEGVENQRQQDILVELGCDELQGYHFAKPMSARALLLWAVDDHPSRPAFKPSLFGDTEISPLID